VLTLPFICCLCVTVFLEAVICNLDTTILVNDLEEVSMSRLHKLHQCKAHMENPVLFKVTCNILPSFVCEEIPLEQGYVFEYFIKLSLKHLTPSENPIVSQVQQLTVVTMIS